MTQKAKKTKPKKPLVWRLQALRDGLAKTVPGPTEKRVDMPHCSVDQEELDTLDEAVDILKSLGTPEEES
jgi:hypothetical protein